MCVKVTLQMGQFKSLNQIGLFCKFQGQFDLEGQGHQFQTHLRYLEDQQTVLSVEAKF